jgi:hypothetical protein
MKHLYRPLALALVCLPSISAGALAQVNRTLSVSELETARLGVYLRLAVERCGYKLRYDPIKSIHPGHSLLDVVSPGSKRDLTDITMQELTKFTSVPKPSACSAAWADYGPQKRKGLWALISPDEPTPPSGHQSFPSQHSFIVCKDLKDLQTYLALTQDKTALIEYLDRTYKSGACAKIEAGTEVSITRRLDNGQRRYACYQVPNQRECVWGPDLFRQQ